jgi:uncharacterized membrane protein YgaE (UPF0421/DUF939 family)
MDQLIGALSEIGPIGIALIVLLIMWLLNRQTTTRYENEITRINEDRDEELKRRDQEIELLKTNRRLEIENLKSELAALKEEIKGLRVEMELERQARRQAEETAHRLSLRLGGDSE